MLNISFDYKKAEKRIEDFKKINQSIRSKLETTATEMLEVISTENYSILRTLKYTKLKKWAGENIGLQYFSERKGILVASSDRENIKIDIGASNTISFGFGNMGFMDAAGREGNKPYWRMFEGLAQSGKNYSGKKTFGGGTTSVTRIFGDTFFFYKKNIEQDIKQAIKENIKRKG